MSENSRSECLADASLADSLESRRGIGVLGLRGTNASLHLDFIRGMSAFAVLIYHIRYRFFWDFGDLQTPSSVDYLFYLVTSFGHDAVMVFFVLSGFFISSSVLRAKDHQRWQWRGYVISRLSRLYVVLVPALLMTLVFDSAGLLLHGDHVVYSGERTSWVSDYFDVGDRLNLSSFLGNLLFLQTIAVAPFGSNDPLWSLAFEFWYYAFLPLLVFSICSNGSRVKQFLNVVALLLLMRFVGVEIARYFVIWMLGTLVCLLPFSSFVERHFWVLAPAALVVAMLAAVAGHLSPVKAMLGGSLYLADLMTGLGFALLLFVVLHHRRESRPGCYASFAKGTSEISYSLYLTHIPLLVFARAMFTDDQPFSLDLQSVCWFLGLSVACVLCASGVYYAAERHTQRVRRFVDTLTKPSVRIPVVGEEP